MKKINKTIVSLVLTYAILGIFFYYVRPALDANEKLRGIFYDDFNNFGEALENLNDEISHILIFGASDFNQNKEYMDRNAVSDFYISNIKAADFRKGSGFYYYNLIYSDINDVIKTILSDGTISASEDNFLRVLYSYNDELIREYKSILGNLYNNWDPDKQTNIEKRIIKIYDDYSNKAEALFNSPNYSLLKNYKGDFKEADYEAAKRYCEEVFSKMVEGVDFKYNNKEDINEDKFIFRTFLERDYKPNITIDDTEYEVEYYKKTGKVVVNVVGLTVPQNRHTEKELDDMTRDLVSKFDSGLYNYDRTVNYDKEGKLESIKYAYIAKVNGTYDEMRKMQVTREVHGLVSKLEIVKPSDKKIAIPLINKEKILEKIDKEADVIDTLIIRNIEGHVEYEVHIKYLDALYAAVFDGDDGTLKYYGRDIRSYDK